MGSRVSLSQNITNKPALSDVQDMQTFLEVVGTAVGHKVPTFKGQCSICFPTRSSQSGCWRLLEDTG